MDNFFNEGHLYITKIRDVKTPNRANKTDAGCDYYVPNFDANFLYDLYVFNKKNNVYYNIALKALYKDKKFYVEINNVDEINNIFIENDKNCIYENIISRLSYEMILENINYEEVKEEIVFEWSIKLFPQQRITIPGGIKATLFPKNSCLTICNKSGIATKKGLVYTSHIIDSFYTGEIAYGVANITNNIVEIFSNEKIVQAIHMPIYLTEPVMINLVEYNIITKDSDRKEGGFGSSGLK